MRIEFEFSGGYGGLFAAEPLVYRADSDKLPRELRDELLALIRSSGLVEEDLTPAAGGPGPQRDVFAYRLSIRDGERSWRFAFDDASVPPTARPLLAFLRKCALETRGGH